MVNARKKGNSIQLKLIKHFKSMHWKAAKLEQKGKFTKETDAFGLFDVMFVRGKDIVFVQITCNRPHSHGKYGLFAAEHASDRLEIHQWVWYDRKGWIKFVYLDDGSKVKIDMRK